MTVNEQARSNSFLLLIILMLSMSGCKDDLDIPGPKASLFDDKIMIADIIGIPGDVVFNRLVADISGTCWEVIDCVEAPYENGEAILELPSSFPSEKFQHVDRSNGMCGHWPAKSDDPNALVATLKDIFAYQDDVRVGRVYLSDWIGEGSTASCAYIYYQYADRPFELSGSNSSFYYNSASFFKGWNVYANINPDTEQRGNILCTTVISDDRQLRWRFERR